MRNKSSTLKVSYIAEFDLPSDRAYAVHVLKMLDNFNYFSAQVELINFSKDDDYNFKKISRDYKLHSLKPIFIKSIFRKKKKNSSFNRLCFGLLSALYLKKKNSLIITRSLFCSFFLTLLKKKHFLEIHNKIQGLSKIIFLFFGFLKSKYIERVIFITKPLKQYYKNKYNKSIILPDGVDIKDFQNKKKIKKNIKNILYIGSFYKGRGIDLILEISKILKDKCFELVGNRKNISKKNFANLKNVKISNFVKYQFVSKKILKADLLLMPYNPKFVGINSENASSETSKIMSPLKMFEYLASGVPLISSDIKVLKEILSDNFNCLMINKYHSTEWAMQIKKLETNYKLRKKISKNGLSTAKKYSWYNRVVKIIKIYKQKNK